jgi:hypothetical protein
MIGSLGPRLWKEIVPEKRRGEERGKKREKKKRRIRSWGLC